MSVSASAQETVELDRLNVIEVLRTRPGLAYAPLGKNGPFLVAFDGHLMGEVYRRGPGMLRCWHPLPYGPDELPLTGQEDQEAAHPYPTARAAAASLMPSPHDDNGSARSSLL